MWDRLDIGEKVLIGMVYKIAGVELKGRECPNLEYRMGLAICKIYKERPWFCKDFYCGKEE